MKARLTVPEVHEAVQLAFLAGLTQRLPARHYILKGGANLRLFLGSPRSSAEMDFDALDIEACRLADKVNDALRAPVVGLILRSHGLAVTRAGSQEQTTTTQRWVVEVHAPGHRLTISTAGEFSHRASFAGLHTSALPSMSRADPIDPVIAARFGAPPTFYETPAAWSGIQDRVATYLLGLS